MNFDFIEGLTNEQIEKVYEEQLEHDYISGFVWYINCSNGRSGFAHENGYTSFPLGTNHYAVNYNSEYAWVQICGAGQYGYGNLIAKEVLDLDSRQNFFVWDVKCSNGRTGQGLEKGYYPFNIGQTAYASWYNETYGIAQVCGVGQYGYGVLVANNKYNR